MPPFLPVTLGRFKLLAQPNVILVLSQLCYWAYYSDIFISVKQQKIMPLFINFSATCKGTIIQFLYFIFIKSSTTNAIFHYYYDKNNQTQKNSQHFTTMAFSHKTYWMMLMIIEVYMCSVSFFLFLIVFQRHSYVVQRCPRTPSQSSCVHLPNWLFSVY